MRREVALVLPLAPSVNKMHHHGGPGGPRLRQSVKRYREEVRARWLESATRWQDRVPLKGSLGVRMRVRLRTGRSRDIDNLLKVLFDALTRAGVWGDDAQVRRLSVVISDQTTPSGEIRLRVRELMPS